MEEILVRYAHFVGMITLGAMLVTQNVLLAKTVTNTLAKKLAVVDGIYGASAMITLFAGLTLWLWLGKPSGFYTENSVFMFKISLFVFIALISLIPTFFFVAHRNSTQPELAIPSYIISIKRLELILLATLPLLAVLMARGIGL
jgi:putative membrane protein